MAGDEGGFTTVDGILAITGQGEVIFSSIGPAEQDLTALRVVPASAYTDKQLRFVEDEAEPMAARGMGAPEMEEIATLVHRVLTNAGDEAVEAEIRDQVFALTAKFPINI